MLDAQRLVGLMAEPDRRLVVAALILEADDPPGIARRTGLELRQVVDALDRLIGHGLVEVGADGHHVVLEQAFKAAARAGAPDRVSEHPDAPPDEARVLDGAFRDGRLVRLPTKRSKRLIVLDHLAQRFDLGVRFTERQVNAVLAAVDTDVASLRRYLVDEGFLDREGGEYWRCGGRTS